LALVGQTLTNWLTKYSLENGLSQADAQRQAQLGIVIVQSVALFAAPVIGIMADRINRVNAVIIAVAISAVGYSSLFLIENPLGFNMKLALMLVGVGEVAGVIVSQVLIAQYERASRFDNRRVRILWSVGNFDGSQIRWIFV
jgi:MFS family permease